jgi:hypothetical protein
MARKKSKIKTTVYVIHLTLREGRDDALIELVCNAPPRRIAYTVRETMRKGITCSEHAGIEETSSTREAK